MTKNTFAILLAAGAVTATACAAKVEAPDAKPRGMSVRTARVEARDLDDALVLTGSLKPKAQVQTVAEVSARLVRIVRDEGARVERGEVLAVLDDIDYRLSHDRAIAALAVADANRAHSVVERERADNLLKTGGITDKDHLAAQVNLQVAEASMGQVKAEAAIAAEQLARCQIKAPFGGRIAKRFVDPGAQLSVGTPVFTVVDDAVLEFRAAVPSADYARLKVGDPVDVTVEALARVVKGRVARITPLVEERTRSFEVVVEVPGGKDLVGGLFARAVVRVGQVAGALVVPPAALVRDGATPGEAQTFVVVGGKAERRTVSVGVEGPQAIQVTKGLAEGDVVVLDPPSALSSGAPVEITNGRK
jgi:membrane fusion protein (multidrug efflux system)